MKLYRLVAFLAALAITLFVASLPALMLTGTTETHDSLVRVEHRLATTLSSFANARA
jgi:hypothetical protein